MNSQTYQKRLEKYCTEKWTMQHDRVKAIWGWHWSEDINWLQLYISTANRLKISNPGGEIYLHLFAYVSQSDVWLLHKRKKL